MINPCGIVSSRWILFHRRSGAQDNVSSDNNVTLIAKAKSPTLRMFHRRSSNDDAAAAKLLTSITTDDFGADVFAIIFAYIGRPEEIMLLRRVCKKWRDLARETVVVPNDFQIDSVRRYNVMRVMTTALPNLQQLSIRDLDN